MDLPRKPVGCNSLELMSSIDVPESLSRDAEVISDTETPESNERICCELAGFVLKNYLSLKLRKHFCKSI